MLYLRMFNSEFASGRIQDFQALQERLSGRLRPLLKPAVHAAAGVLGIEPEKLRKSAIRSSDPYEPVTTAAEGEIFTDGQSLFLLAALTPTRQRTVFRTRRLVPDRAPDLTEQRYRLTLSFLGPVWESPTLEEVIDQIQSAIGVSLDPYTYPSDQFAALKAEGREGPPPPSSEELEAAEILRDRPLRNLAVAIKASGGLLVRDVPKQLANDTGDVPIAVEN